jgi:hypothetical protein
MKNEADALVHAAKRRQAQQVLSKELEHKRSLLVSIEQRKKLEQSERSRRDRHGHLLQRGWTMLSMGMSTMGAMFALCFGGWMALAGIGIHPGSPPPCMNLTIGGREFTRVEDYVTTLFANSANGQEPVTATIADPGEAAAQTSAILKALTGTPVKILSIQANRMTDEYLVYCDFGQRGRINLQVIRDGDGFRVVFAESYF